MGIKDVIAEVNAMILRTPIFLFCRDMGVFISCKNLVRIL